MRQSAAQIRKTLEMLARTRARSERLGAENRQLREQLGRLRGQRDCRLEDDRLRLLADSMPQLVWTAEPDGRVDYYNIRSQEFAGLTQSDDGTWHWEPIVHSDDQKATTEAWQKAVRTGEKYEIAHRVKRSDGSYRWYLSRGTPAHDAQGRVIKWYGTATDIHDQKMAEEAAREADRQKNEFLAILSHELRNPLAPILNSVYILERAPEGGGQARRAMQVIERQAHHMTRLVEDLLDLTRISRGKIVLKREPVDLNALARSTAEDHRSSFERHGIHLEVIEAPRPVYVDGDPTRLSQAIGNLLSNSGKFTPRGGSTTLIVELPAQGMVSLRVRDNGAGLSPETLEVMFEPFVQAERTLDRSRGGLGLGLALVKGLVQMHGGRVEAHSAGLGKGAEFTMTLPLAAWNGRVLELSEESSERGGAKRVLVIEDNDDAAESLREVLELGNHLVEVAGTGTEGLARARWFKPDVVLCDIGLPGMDGYGIAEAMRSDPKLRGTYLVALSGYALPEDIERAKRAGFDKHMAKPPSIEVIEKMLAEVPRKPD